jgi:alpha-L-rhamnosidase
MQTSMPSWLYAVEKGATTMWEYWEGIEKDGSPAGSLNHYAFGSIGDWLYRYVVGIAPAAPGYKRIRFEPRPGGGLMRASATHLSPYGEIKAAWEVRDDTFHYRVTVPQGTTAEVRMPDANPVEVGPGSYELSADLKNKTV